jgi:hypothetical protein
MAKRMGKQMASLLEKTGFLLSYMTVLNTRYKDFLDTRWHNGDDDGDL